MRILQIHTDRRASGCHTGREIRERWSDREDWSSLSYGEEDSAVGQALTIIRFRTNSNRSTTNSILSNFILD